MLGVRDPQRDDGAALVMVIAVGAVLAMLMTLLVTVSVSGAKQASADADWNAALAAAYAGVDEYQSRLSADTSYYRFGNPASSFGDPAKVSAPPTANPAFGVGSEGSWATVEGSVDRAQFRYEVDNSRYADSGRIRIRSTGKVGDATRTVVADLKQQGFIDFLYFTDYEVQDPIVAAKAPADSCYTDGKKTTLKHAWEDRTGACNEITFGDEDVIKGPVHSNDTIRACGTTFEGTVTTANPKSPYYLPGAGCSKTTFMPGSPANSGGVIGMPPTNSQLKRETRTDLTDVDVPRPGCLYTGPTQFEFFGDGTVNIKSPFTKVTRIGNAGATSGTTPPECGQIAQLQSLAGATIPVPDNNVMYVQNVPHVVGDVNTWVSGVYPAGFTCVATTHTPAKNGWYIADDKGKNRSGYPAVIGSNTEAAVSGTPYGCDVGDVFVKGKLDGAVTVAAENYVFIVGDITYKAPDDDILGLIGNNAVWVWNPRTSSGTFMLGKHRTIEAAVLSVAHTFQVQSYDKGSSRGELTVRGAIAQKFRGPVGTDGGAGYDKTYVYDDRFAYLAPPKFLNPVTTTYGVTTWVESAAVWNADGSAR